ncbi:MAG: bifunctional phosphoribosylaminoimidazolecarboxamide formyltransferase/IMP cyclohydrolase [Planctomycetota bacterium]|nr:bifunctional phosphoribosylaminoimidazolecarboxamide formyltransferase/IMP cyclohydrolase [Planctomycetota bacterium]
MSKVRIRWALLSVYDKTGLVEFARGLARMGISFLSSGGTASALRDAGLEVTDVSEYTGSPEILGGRVKTLHPKIHGGILARTDDPAHRKDLERDGIDPIDMVVCNLYPFEKTVAAEGVSMADAIEQIDIGGVTLLRAAAKNHERVVVVPAAAEYTAVLKEMEGNEGSVSAETRLRLGISAFSRTAAYDCAIAGWLPGRDGSLLPLESVALTKLTDLRYGENPHQRAALYTDGGRSKGVAGGRIRAGKQLSYNNLLDLSAASGLAYDLEAPCCVVVKHTNPCGAAVADSLEAAFCKAHECDPLSAFGSVVAFNQPLDGATARRMTADAPFVEALIAPEVNDEVVEILRSARWGKSLRIVEAGPASPRYEMRSISGGYLLQTGASPTPDDKVQSSRAPTDQEWKDLRFAWGVVRHVKSNAIVFASEGATVGIGGGQMSRVDSVHIAVRKAGDRAKGAVLASDGFFPFPDGLEAAAAAGVTAAIQPGGSKRDPEVIEAANRLGVALVHTGVRHFLH